MERLRAKVRREPDFAFRVERNRELRAAKAAFKELTDHPMTIEKLPPSTSDFTRQNIARLAELFPECVTEGPEGTASDGGGPVIDFDLLRQALSDHAVEGPQERYRLDWPGKRRALLAANAPIDKTLRPMREESVDFDTSRNLFIEGDNLDALKLLQETYLGKVRMIYIDPPYNTGRDFIYKDNFAQSKDSYETGSGQRDEEGGRLFANSESNGRFHSDWLSMIYPRLKLARNLLRDDGFILISIDDAEVTGVKKIADEIFGESGHLATLVWDKNRKNDARYFSVGHEYMLVYAKSERFLSEAGIVLREPRPGLEEARTFYERLRGRFGESDESVQREWRAFYSKIDSTDPRKKIGRFSKIGPDGPYRDDGNISWPGGGGPKYEVLHPGTGKACKVPDGGWRYPKPERFWEEYERGNIAFGPDETTLPRQRRNLFDGDGLVMPSVFFSYAQTSAVEFAELMEGRVFDNPKNWRDLQRLVRYLTGPSDIVLDFFAGSGTTAHAVFEQNAADGGARRWILVQLHERVEEESEAGRAGFRTIAQLSRDRIRRAGRRTAEASGSLRGDVGFRAFRIDSGNFHDTRVAPAQATQAALAGMISHIKEDRGDEDLLFGALLRWGVDVTLPVAKRELLGRTVWLVDPPAENGEGAALIACFARPSKGKGGIDVALADALAQLKPLRVLFRDDGFVSDSAKENVSSRLKQRSPDTSVRVL